MDCKSPRYDVLRQPWSHQTNVVISSQRANNTFPTYVHFTVVLFTFVARPNLLCTYHVHRHSQTLHTSVTWDLASRTGRLLFRSSATPLFMHTSLTFCVLSFTIQFLVVCNDACLCFMWSITMVASVCWFSIASFLVFHVRHCMTSPIDGRWLPSNSRLFPHHVHIPRSAWLWHIAAAANVLLTHCSCEIF